MTYYKILQWTPFPNRFEHIPEWQLQEAEYDLKINTIHYYEWVIKEGDCFFYPLEIAECIVSYWQNRWPFADYQLIEVAPSVHPKRQKPSYGQNRQNSTSGATPAQKRKSERKMTC